MILCNNCGKENKDSSKFCTGCGNNMLTSIQSVSDSENISLVEKESNQLLCIKCGCQNKINAKFCVKCGSNIASSMQPVKQQQNTSISEITINEFICNQCGKENKENAKFCVACGNKLGILKQTLEQNTNSAIESVSINNNNDIQQEVSIDEKYINEHEDAPIEIQEIVQEDLSENNFHTLQIDKSSYHDEYASEETSGDQNSNAKIDITANRPAQNGNAKEYVDQTSESIPVIEEYYYPFLEKKRKKPIFWVIGILVLVGLGIATFYLVGSSSNKIGDKSALDVHDTIKHSPNLIKQEVDSKTDTNSKNFKKKSSHDKLYVTADTSSLAKKSEQDDFKYLSINQIKNDLFNMQLCGGMTYRDQKVTIVGFFPDKSFQKTIIDNEQVTITVNVKDLSGNQSCTVEVFYKKSGNKFRFENYAEK